MKRKGDFFSLFIQFSFIKKEEKKEKNGDFLVFFSLCFSFYLKKLRRGEAEKGETKFNSFSPSSPILSLFILYEREWKTKLNSYALPQ